MTGDLTNAILVEARVFRNTTTNANELKAIKTGFLIQETPGVDIQQGTDFSGSNISGVGTTTTTNIKADVIASVLGGINDDILVNNDFAMNNAGIINVQQIAMVGDIRMNNNDIGGTINTANVNATNVDTTTLDAGNVNITSNTITSSSVLEFKSGSSDRVNFKSDNGILSIENNNLGGVVRWNWNSPSLVLKLFQLTSIQLGLVNLELENFDTLPSNFELEADFVIRSLGTSAQVAVQL